MCFWSSWEVVDDGILRLNVLKENCCDMGGAIRAAEHLCPSVWRIDVYADDIPDVMYFRAGGNWKALDASNVKTFFPPFK
jgi:hypothetical protein